MVQLVVATVALAGTCLQMLLALVDAKEAHRDALEWAKAEDQIVAEQPFWSRRRSRRELRSWRDPQTDKSLAYIDALVFSWALLVAASAVAAVAALAEL